MSDPAYLHVVLNHAPVFLLLAALVPILIGVITRSRASLNAGLLLVVIAAGTTGVVMWSGEEAEELVEHGDLAEFVDSPGEAWMHTHGDRADLTAKVVYVTGGFAVLCLLLSFGSDKVRAVFGLLCVLGVLTSAWFLGWTAQAGGQVMHAEFRDAERPYPKPWNDDAPQEGEPDAELKLESSDSETDDANARSEP